MYVPSAVKVCEGLVSVLLALSPNVHDQEAADTLLSVKLTINGGAPLAVSGVKAAWIGFCVMAILATSAPQLFETVTE